MHLVSTKTPCCTHKLRFDLRTPRLYKKNPLKGNCCTCRMPLSGKSNAAEVPPVPSIQLTMVCRASSWL